MQIIADKQIANVHQTFSPFAQVLLYDGYALDAEKMQCADALLVRSVSRVDENLLAGSPIKLVASATSGREHIDIDYLQRQHIGFVDAAGANARAVAEYVLSSLFVLAEQAEFNLQDKVVAVVGCGRIGSLVVSMLDAVGVVTLMYDPPLQALASDDLTADKYCDLQVLDQADIISLHVTLTSSGRYPTQGLVDAEFLEHLKDDVILLNTSRGDVIDEPALKQHMLAYPNMRLVLDVWSGEPNIDLSLLATTTIGTPHIAGYSAEGKHLANTMVFQSIGDFFGLSISLPAFSLSELEPLVLPITDAMDNHDTLKMAVLASYDVRVDDLSVMDAQQFTMLRRDYPLRREFSAMTIQCPQHREQLTLSLQRLGFKVCH